MIGILKQHLKRYCPNLVVAFHDFRSVRELEKKGFKTTPFGFRLMGNKGMQDGGFENEETLLVREYLKNADVFVDVGANVGFYACLARSINKKTIAIEPLAQNLRYLFANLQANGWIDVEVHPVGLAARPGIARFYGGGTSASLIRKWAGTSEVWQRFIPLSTLDILLGSRFAGRRLLIKIDVEGSEYDVIKGAVDIIAMSPSPAWLLEICLTEHHPMGINPHFSDVFHAFWSKGYRAYVADRSRREVLQSDVARWKQNRKRDFGFINYLFER